MLRIIAAMSLAAEIVVSYFFIKNFGFLTFLFEVFATAILGAFFMFTLGLANFVQRIVMLKVTEFGASIGGFLLFLPGILSDILGAVLVIISFIFFNKKGNQKNRQDRAKADDVIDVEVIE